MSGTIHDCNVLCAMCYDIVLFVLMSYDNAYAVLNLIQRMEKK